MANVRVSKVFAVVAMAFLSMTVCAQTPVVHRTASDFVYGTGFIASNVETGTQTFAEVSANEHRDIQGNYRSTSIFVRETTYSFASFAQRSLSCTVDKSALQTLEQRAELSVSVDAASDSCVTWGDLCGESGCAPWGYVGIVGVGGQWHDSQFETRSTQRLHTTDNLNGTSSMQNCQSSTGDNSQGGIVVGSNTYLFGPQGYGAFQSYRCTTANK
jgi:hypothetical protein